MHSYLAVAASLFLHLLLISLLSLKTIPSPNTDFGKSSSPIIVSLKSSKKNTPLVSKKVTKKQKTQPEQVRPRGFKDLIVDFIPPVYPAYAIKNSIEGKVLIKLSINSKGLVEKVIILKKSNSSLLDESAIKAAKGWSFLPSEKGSFLTKEIIFKLD